MQVRARPTSRHGRKGLATAWCRPWPQREGSERSTRHKEIRRRARRTSVVTDMTNTTQNTRHHTTSVRTVRTVNRRAPPRHPISLAWLLRLCEVRGCARPRAAGSAC